MGKGGYIFGRGSSKFLEVAIINSISRVFLDLPFTC